MSVSRWLCLTFSVAVLVRQSTIYRYGIAGSGTVLDNSGSTVSTYGSMPAIENWVRERVQARGGTVLRYGIRSSARQPSPQALGDPLNTVSAGRFGFPCFARTVGA